jgi:hypothetical protein
METVFSVDSYILGDLAIVAYQGLIHKIWKKTDYFQKEMINRRQDIARTGNFCDNRRLP